MKFSQTKARYAKDVKALQSGYEEFLKKRAVIEAQLRFMEQERP
jgi:hypothetical protein